MVIRVAGVVKRFGAATAVDHADLTVADGELFTLLGPSGCGKTTLLRLIAGFAPARRGRDPLRRPRGDRAAPPRAQYRDGLPELRAVAPHDGGGERVLWAPDSQDPRRCRSAPGSTRGCGRSISPGLEARYPGQLSGGQQQRVALARALVLEPDILLLDEPLSNLDAKIRVQVRAEIRLLQQALRITTIYVTHDQEEALSLSDRVAVMKDGRVLQVGAPKELYERPRTRFVADFVGTNNLVAGEVLERRDQELVVRTAIGQLRAIPNGAVAGRCVLAIRPENVALGPAAGGATDGNVVRARVALVSYLGNTLRYDLETAGGLVLKADIRDPWHHDPLAIGHESPPASPHQSPWPCPTS